MSMFDPYYLYTPTRKRSTKDGQILHKRSVNPNFAVSGDDLDRAKNVMKSFNYYFSPTGPRYLTVPVSYGLNNASLVNRIDVAFDLMFSNLHDYIRSLMLAQYSDIFTSNYSAIQFVLLLNSFQGSFTDTTSSSGTVNYYVANRLTYSYNYSTNQSYLLCSISPIDNSLLDYTVFLANDGNYPNLNYLRNTGSGQSFMPGVLQAYQFQNGSEIFNYFKDENPDTNPFPTNNQVGLATSSVNIKADRLIAQFTLNIFITYFFFNFFLFYSRLF